MPLIRYQQLDVFAARPGGGNPLGVVVDATGWTDDAMQAFARWTNLVETTFLLPPTQPGASYRVRIFTPRKEIPFAGHPTIGSAHAALDAGLCQPSADGLLHQECGAGVLPIRVEDHDGERVLFVQTPPSRVVPSPIGLSALRDVMHGVRAGQLPPAFVEGGRRWWVAEFADEAQLRQWHPDHGAIGMLARDTDSLGLCVFARSAEPGIELAVRAFPSGVDIVEDPASGAANGLVAAYIAQAEPDGSLARGYRVSQGREVGHDASITVRIDGSDIWVGGRTNTIIDGQVHWPQA